MRIRQAKPAFKKVKEIAANTRVATPEAEQEPLPTSRQSSENETRQAQRQKEQPSATPIIERVPVGDSRDITPLIRTTPPATGAPTPATTETSEEQAPMRTGARLLEATVAEIPATGAPATTAAPESATPAQVYATAAETYRGAPPSTVYTPAGQQQKRNDPGYRVERPSEPVRPQPIPILRGERGRVDAGGVREVRRDFGERRFAHDARTPYESRQYELPEDTQSKKKRQLQPWE